MIQPEKQVSAADIEAAAGDWIARLDRTGQLDSDCDVEALVASNPAFASWVSQDLRHRISFLQLLSTWQRTERLAALQAGNVEASPKPPKHFAKWMAIATPVAAAVCLGLLVPVMGWFAPSSSEPEVYFSQMGQQRVVTLEDGTVMTLNTNSRVDVSYSGGVRLAVLVRGEALFEVAKDPERPFRLDTPSGDIEVLGTVFGAELKSDALEVAVVEGIVALTPESGSQDHTQRMTAGMIGHSNAMDVITEDVGVDEVEDRLLWRSGRIRFKNMPLSDVADEFNRYSRRELVITDEVAAQLRIGGTFAADNMDGFVRLAETGMGLNVNRSPDRVEISSK